MVVVMDGEEVCLEEREARLDIETRESRGR
jgi:hypothetical protein